MVWLGAVWHLLGVLHSLPDLSQATLIAGVALAILTIAAYTLSRSARPPAGPAVTIAARRRTTGAVAVVRAGDPDAPGHIRPRAPSR
jgi:hypothetical protein